jgi:diguanylate cyclase (GGDEF)-like protein
VHGGPESPQPRQPGAGSSPKELSLFSSAGVTDDQLHAMWQACSDIAAEPDTRRACRRLADEVTRIISAPALIFRRDVSPWKAIGASSAAAHPPLAPQLDALTLWTGPTAVPIAGSADARWTPVPLGDDAPSQVLLLLPGDWQSGHVAAWLPRFAATASLALRLVSARGSARRGQALAGMAYAFARRVGQVTALRLVYQLIVETAARSADARLVSLSVQRPRDSTLTVAATHGYPREAAGDVRIAPGSGVIGGVFASKRPLLVRDTARVPGFTSSSSRYRTTSFMALPIVAGREAIGVLTLADRTDGAPFTRDNLAAARLITALSSLALLRAELTALTEDLAQAAATDSLTTLYNRRYLETRLEAEFERNRRLGLPVSLVMLDIDGFKAVNDRLGHQTGDIVLRRVAEIIRRSVRASDVCTRYGGDEFAIIVPESAASAAQTAARIRQRVERFAWEALGLPADARVTLSAGIGVAEAGESAEELIRRADQHMYKAKGLGRNRVFPPDA